MTYGVTEQGFVLKRLNDILTDMKTVLAQVQDPKTGEFLTPDLLDENDPLVLLINAFADSLYAGWEQLQLSYNQFDPLKATGAGLSGLVQLNGLLRKAGIKSTAVVTITGTAGKVVPAGKQISDINSTYIWDLPAFTIGIGGTVETTATASEYGPIEAASGTLVKILTPYSGWTSVTNTADAVVGTSEETDTILRSRQRDSTTVGQSTIESIYSALMQLEGVTYARVYQNITLLTDSRGIPAKSVAAVVVGGSEADIAATLFDHVPAGCATYGSTEIYIYGVQGVDTAMYFTYPAEIDIYIDIEVEVVDASIWPDDAADRIKANIISYATSGAVGIGIDTGFDQDGYTPGQSVYASELYTPINYIHGARIVSVFVGTTGSPADPSVVIDWNEIAVFDSANINITES